MCVPLARGPPHFLAHRKSGLVLSLNLKVGVYVGVMRTDVTKLIFFSGGERTLE